MDNWNAGNPAGWGGGERPVKWATLQQGNQQNEGNGVEKDHHQIKCSAPHRPALAEGQGEKNDWFSRVKNKVCTYLGYILLFLVYQ